MPDHCSPPPARPLRRRLAVAAAALLLLGGCAEAAGQEEPDVAPAPAEPTTAAPTAGGYVALGDSYTAAPFVPQTDVASGCFRSDGNYPALVAAELGAELTDVSCSGAETADVTRSQVEGVAPQAAALSADVDLVTVGLGGNDGGVFTTLVSRCRALGGIRDLAQVEGRTCPDPLTQEDVDGLVDTLDETRARLLQTLEVVQRRSPQARVLVVGYPQIVSADRRCEALPLAPRDQAYAAELNRGLDETVRAAAREARVDFVDVYAATRNHDICAEEPWVNGIVTDERRALAFHPFAAGQQAVAELVVDALAD